MKLKKEFSGVVNTKPILKKSNSGAVNTPMQQSPRRKSQEQHQLQFANVEFGKSVRDTFRLKKKKEDYR